MPKNTSPEDDTWNEGAPVESLAVNIIPSSESSTSNNVPVEPTTLNTVEPDPITSRACVPEAEMIADPVILAVPVNGKASPPTLLNLNHHLGMNLRNLVLMLCCRI